MLIYKIFRRREWDDFETTGQTLGAPVDLADGFIHFSTPDQAPETAARHFSQERDLILAAVDTEGLDNLTWEPSRNGEEFPHLYGPLARSAVAWHRPLPLKDGRHQFPAPQTVLR